MTSTGSGTGLRHIVTTFDLPLVVMVPDSIEDKPLDFEHYRVAMHGSAANRTFQFASEIRFKKNMRDLGGVMAAIEDTRGALSYSRAQVWLDRRFIGGARIGPNWRASSDLIVTASLMVLNRFLEIYRDVTARFWARPVTRGNIAQFVIVAIDEDDNQDTFIYGQLGTGRAFGSTVRGEEDELLRSRLLSDYQVDDVQRLAYVVRDLIDASEYWAAVLAAEMLFEAKVARILRSAFIRNGSSETEADEKFETARGPRSVTSLLVTYLPELTGDNPRSVNAPLGAAFSAWEDKAKDLRNLVAHGRQMTVDRQAAREALAAIAQLIDEIEARLPDTSPTRLWPDIR